MFKLAKNGNIKKTLLCRKIYSLKSQTMKFKLSSGTRDRGPTKLKLTLMASEAFLESLESNYICFLHEYLCLSKTLA